QPEELHHRRKEIDLLRLIGPTGRCERRARDHERDVDRLVVEMRPVLQAAMLLELLAMVGGDDDDRRVGEPEPRERGEDLAERRVPGLDLTVVERPEVGELRRRERRLVGTTEL